MTELVYVVLHFQSNIVFLLLYCVVNISFSFQVPPSLIQIPQDQVLEEGNSAMFSCQANGFPPPIVTWSKGNNTLLL